MQWIEATIDTKTEEIDALCMQLTELGVQGVSIEDEADLNQFLEKNRQYWDYIDESLSKQFHGVSRIKFYLIDDESGRANLSEIRTAMGREIKEKRIDDQNWEYTWRDNYQPIEIGNRIVILPEWMESSYPGKTVLRLDPGLAFGTGSHATTRMCLEVLDTLELRDKKVLDLGFGSGILSIAALLLGASSAAGCDVDPNAVTAARENAALNDIQEKNYLLRAGNILADEGLRRSLDGNYDLVMANIVADVVIALTDHVERYLAPEGLFLCSGIIDERREETEQALKKHGFEIVSHLHQEEWNCYLTKRTKT